MVKYNVTLINPDCEDVKMEGVTSETAIPIIKSSLEQWYPFLCPINFTSHVFYNLQKRRHLCYLHLANLVKIERL